MKELYELSFSGPNLLPTIFLLLVVVYWVVFLLGFLDLSFLDFDAGGKDIGHAGADGDSGEIGKAGHVDPGAKDFSATALDFLNLTHVPFMIVFSFFALVYWALSLIGNHYLSDGTVLLTLAILVGGFVLAVLVSKLLTQPLRGLFKRLNDLETKLHLIGKTCTLELGVSGQKLGQADIVIGNKHLLLTVRAFQGETIQKGTTCLIVDEASEDEERIFLVQSLTDEETSK